MKRGIMFLWGVMFLFACNSDPADGLLNPENEKNSQGSQLESSVNGALKLQDEIIATCGDFDTAQVVELISEKIWKQRVVFIYYGPEFYKMLYPVIDDFVAGAAEPKYAIYADSRWENLTPSLAGPDWDPGSGTWSYSTEDHLLTLLYDGGGKQVFKILALGEEYMIWDFIHPYEEPTEDGPCIYRYILSSQEL